jgi:hypothetical protein
MKIKQGMVLNQKDDNSKKTKILAVCGEAVLRSVTNLFDKAYMWYTEEDLIKDGWLIPEEKWEPEYIGEKYYCIVVNSHLDFTIIEALWSYDSNDRKRQNFIGIFPTKEKAEEYLKEFLKALEEIKIKLK